METIEVPRDLFINVMDFLEGQEYAHEWPPEVLGATQTEAKELLKNGKAVLLKANNVTDDVDDNS